MYKMYVRNSEFSNFLRTHMDMENGVESSSVPFLKVTNVAKDLPRAAAGSLP